MLMALVVTPIANGRGADNNDVMMFGVSQSVTNTSVTVSGVTCKVNPTILNFAATWGFSVGRNVFMSCQEKKGILFLNIYKLA
jgi:hypothetical protein